MVHLSVGAVVAALLGGCGPSLRLVHLGDQYFERCYMGDQDDRYDDGERRRCWDAWLQHHTTGQSDERIGHARERLLQLSPDSAAVEMATGEMEMAEEEAALARVPVVVLTGMATGTDVAAPEGRETTPELVERHRPPPPRSSTTRCDASCRPGWETCVDACAAIGTRPEDMGCIDACRVRFRSCASGCY